MKKPAIIQIFLLLFAFFLFQVSTYANLFESFGTDPYAQGMSGAGSANSGNWGAAFRNPAGLALPWPQPKETASTLLKDNRPEQQRRLNAINEKLATLQMVHPLNSEQLDQLGALHQEKAELLQLKSHERRVIRHIDGRPLGNRAFDRHQFGLSYIQHSSQMNIKLENNSSSQASKFANEAVTIPSAGYLSVGFAIDLRSLIMTPFDLPVRLGGAFGLSPDGTVSQQPSYSEKRYNFKELGANASILTAAVSIGLQVWKDRLSIGGGPGGNIVIEGNAEVSNITLDESSPPDIQAKVNAKTMPAPVFGFIYRHPLENSHNLYIGGSFRSSTKVETDLEIFVAAPLGIEVEVESLGEVIVSPNIFIAALAYDTGTLNLALDIEYQAWSQVKRDSTKIYELEYNYSDIFVFRTGVELGFYSIVRPNSSLAFLREFTIRSGYAYFPSYIPDQTSSSNHLDTDKHIISFGIGKFFAPTGLFKKAVILDWSFQWQIWASRSAQKDGNESFYDDSIQPSYSYGGNVFITGLSVTFKL